MIHTYIITVTPTIRDNHVNHMYVKTRIRLYSYLQNDNQGTH